MEDILAKVTVIAQANSSLAALWLYGSRARGDHRADSDYDFAVAFSQWETAPLERRLCPELLAIDWHQQLELPEHSLSIVDIALAPIPLAWTIISEGKLLVDNDPESRLSQEERIMSIWEIDYHYHQKRLADHA